MKEKLSILILGLIIFNTVYSQNEKQNKGFIEKVGTRQYEIGTSQDEIQYKKLIKSAVELYKTKNYISSLKEFENAFIIIDDNSLDLYNAACIASLLKDKTKSLYYLNKSLDNGFNDSDNIKKDEDLLYLHPFVEWIDILERTKQNKDNTKTDEQITNEIATLISTNNPLGLWDNCSENYKSNITKQYIIDVTKQISQLLNENRIGNIKNLPSSKKITSTFRNDTCQISYTLVPKYFGEWATTFSDEFLPGATIDIQLLKTRQKWQLSSLKLKENYFNPDFDIAKYVRNFLSQSGETTLKFGFISLQKKIYGRSELSKDNLEIPDIFKSLNLQSVTELKNQSDSSSVYFLSLNKITPNKSEPTDLFSTMFTPENSNIFLILEFNIDNNRILISDGKKYGIYNCTRKGDLINLKDKIFNRIVEIK